MFHAAEEQLTDLRTRILATRWPDAEVAEGQGVPLALVQEVAHHWATEYDWRRCEQRINALPQTTVTIDGVPIHALHVRSRHEHAQPLVLTHGWPGSFLEFLDIIGPLTDPEDPADAFHVVVPSLPGFGLSGVPRTTGWDTTRIAGAWVELMRHLGYERFCAQGGDWGAMVTTALGQHHPESVTAIHLNMPSGSRPKEDQEPTEAERRTLSRLAGYRRDGDGYLRIQSTRPQTLGYGLADSPVGLCAWILEKLIHWTDGDPLTLDQKLDNITLYWLTNTATSAARLYWENPIVAPSSLVRVPAGCSLFSAEPIGVPQRWAEQVYQDLRYWNELDRGGHFAAWEQPEIFVGELRAFFRLVRS